MRGRPAPAGPARRCATLPEGQNYSRGGAGTGKSRCHWLGLGAALGAWKLPPSATPLQPIRVEGRGVFPGWGGAQRIFALAIGQRCYGGGLIRPAAVGCTVQLRRVGRSAGAAPAAAPWRAGGPSTGAGGWTRTGRSSSRKKRKGLRRSVRAPYPLSEGSSGPAACFGGSTGGGAAAKAVFPRSVEDQRFSGRDSLIFLVDASKAMFESDGNGRTPFDMTIQVAMDKLLKARLSHSLLKTIAF